MILRADVEGHSHKQTETHANIPASIGVKQV